MTTKRHFSDQELQAAFDGFAGGKTYEAIFIPVGGPSEVALWDKRLLSAVSKPEAVQIAREYGKRIIGKKLQYVYLVPKGRWR